MAHSRRKNVELDKIKASPEGQIAFAAGEEAGRIAKLKKDEN